MEQNKRKAAGRIHWQAELPLPQIVEAFFSGLKLIPRLYEDTLPVLLKLRAEGYRIAALTNLPSAMPDSLFCEGLQEPLPLLDLYVSSGLCGYRKPHPAGLLQIAAHFQREDTPFRAVKEEGGAYQASPSIIMVKPLSSSTPELARIAFSCRIPTRALPATAPRTKAARKPT